MNRSSKTVIKRVSNDLNFHNSQIAGPSTRNVPYVPPIDIADLSTQNEPDILELHSDSDDNIDDISVQVSQNNTQNMEILNTVYLHQRTLLGINILKPI
ncbi:uncharacterized protein TNCV_3419121 [Trichonephila clavipes]|nr:uncharacterized protein TNCV_3616961 [Trichonephila clavipes]GFW99681.1 uncharacterized protein TNCV_3419121 [Trichonephila clavipes]